MTLKRAGGPCVLELLGVFARFFNAERAANFPQKIKQFLRKLGVSLCSSGL